MCSYFLAERPAPARARSENTRIPAALLDGKATE